MAVVINEFEAVAEPQQQRGGDAAGSAEPQRKIKPPDLRPALLMLAARRARLRAH
jgi:hypothetical protein